MGGRSGGPAGRARWLKSTVCRHCCRRVRLLSCKARPSSFLSILGISIDAPACSECASISTHGHQLPDPNFRQSQRPAPEAVSQDGRAHQRAGALFREARRCGPAREDPGVQGPRRQGRVARRPAARGLRDGARRVQARHEDAPFRRSAAGRHGAAQRQDLRDAHGRRQDADGHAAGVPERAHRQGRACGHGERLPREPRCAVDGAPLQLPRAHGRHQPAADAARGKAGGLRQRHHLRHQQRVRLRLPARQHGLRDARPRPARTELCDRRRGGFDPDRRGPHAADHQRPGRGPYRALSRDQQGRSAPGQAGGRGRHPHRRGRDQAGRLHGRREDAPGVHDRGRPREGRADPRRIQAAARGRVALRPGQHHADAPPECRAARAAPVPPRPALRGAAGRGGDRRRIHRSPDDGPALERRPAPGRGGQGRRRDPGREPDAGFDHLPELLPSLRQARRHDRHGRHRGL
ncbi:hypothetical protein L963_1318 [Leuconostoc mesenteroides subsp. cremoris T26]|nr:hypothetical protein L963_1318 [Leuconostoc mesenteroides subsp. cremoris T26]